MLRFSLRRDHVVLEPAAAVGDVPRLLLQRRRLPGDPADDHRPLREHLRARRPDHDHRRPAARRHPADHARDHRRVRRAASTTRSSTGRCTWSASASTSRSRREPMRIAVLGAGVAGLVAATAPDAGRATPSTSTSAGPGSAARRRRSTSATATCSSATTTTCSRPTATSPRSTTSWGCRTSSSGSRARRGLLRRRASQWPFVTPLDLLRFKPLPPLARVRLGAAVLAIQRGPGNPAPFERITARKWIERYMGRDAYRALWGPLLRGKFGERADDIAMVWLQNKFRLRRGDDAAEEKLGYPKHSWELLFDALRDADRGRRRARADRPPGGAARAAASSSPRARPARSARGHDPRDVRDAASPSATRRSLATRPQRRLRAAARARRAPRGLPGEAARDRVLHRALPADRARPPVLARSTGPTSATTRCRSSG